MKSLYNVTSRTWQWLVVKMYCNRKVYYEFMCPVCICEWTPDFWRSQLLKCSFTCNSKAEKFIMQFTNSHYIVACFEVTRHRHVSRLVADSCSRSKKSTIMLQWGWQSVVSLQSVHGHFRPDPWTWVKFELRSWSSAQKISRKEFKRTVRSSSKSGRVPAQRWQFKLEFRSLALAIWVNPEEELVPDGIQGTTSSKQTLLKKLIQVNYLCCRRNCSKWL
jgi:hypothetical protein